MKPLLPLCPYCGHPLLDLSMVTKHDDKFMRLSQEGFIPIGCCSPYCGEQPDYYIKLCEKNRNNNSQKE